MSPAGWTLARLSLLPGDELRHLAVDVGELPSWAVELVRRRHAESHPNEWGVVFTSPLGKLRDPSNTQSDLRKLFDTAGYRDITSHTFRRSVATLMDRAGLSARAAADQLGHARVSMTTDRYFGRRLASTGAAGLLEAVVTGAEAASSGPADEKASENERNG